MTGCVTEILNDFPKMTYLGCPGCFSKTPGYPKEKYTCSKCHREVAPTAHWFFRVRFQDCSGSQLEIGFSRESADALMQMTAYEWYRLQPKAEHLQTEVKFREIKVQCKIKDEQFKGEYFTRYYA